MEEGRAEMQLLTTRMNTLFWSKFGDGEEQGIRPANWEDAVAGAACCSQNPQPKIYTPFEDTIDEAAFATCGQQVAEQPAEAGAKERADDARIKADVAELAPPSAR